MAVNVQAVIILALFSSSLQQNEESFYNRVVDMVITQNYHPDTIILQQTAQSFPMELGSILLEEGTLLGLASVARHGDAKFMKGQQGEAVVDLEFGNLQVLFRKHLITFMSLKLNLGHVVTSNARLFVRLYLKFGRSVCDIKLDRVEFLSFEDFNIKLVSKCDWCARISDFVFNKILHVFNPWIKDTVKRSIVDVLNYMVMDFQRECFDQGSPYHQTYKNLADQYNSYSQE